MIVTVEDLRAMSERLFSHLESTGQAAVHLSMDYYWDAPSQARYDPYKQPEQLTLGQVSDDWAELRKLETGEMEPIAYGLVWLSAVLRAVGDSAVG